MAATVVALVVVFLCVPEFKNMPESCLPVQPTTKSVRGSWWNPTEGPRTNQLQINKGEQYFNLIFLECRAGWGSVGAAVKER